MKNLLIMLSLVAAATSSTATAATLSSENYRFRANEPAVAPVELASPSYGMKAMSGAVTSQEKPSSPSYKITPVVAQLPRAIFNISDALLALQIGAGITQPKVEHLTQLDVGPMINGQSAPDGKIDLQDAVIILRKSVGLLPQ